jgi:hypothetical protein
MGRLAMMPAESPHRLIATSRMRFERDREDVEE